MGSSSRLLDYLPKKHQLQNRILGLNFRRAILWKICNHSLDRREKAISGHLAIRRFHDMAVGYAFSILNDFHLAEDVAQEAFVQAFSRLSQLADPAAFPGWFRRIVFNRCDRILRKKSVNTVPLDSASREADSLDSPTIQMEKKELSNSVHLAIAELKEAERAVTTLFYITGYSLTEVAKFLEIPESTVKSRLFTARRETEGHHHQQIR